MYYIRLIFPFALPTVRSTAHGAIIGGLCESKTLFVLLRIVNSHIKNDRDRLCQKLSPLSKIDPHDLIGGGVYQS